MVLVDTSVWVDHLQHGDVQLSSLLIAGQILSHPFVVGEIALGNLRNRVRILTDLHGLPRAVVASDAETMSFIGSHRLYGKGIGYVDAHLLAAARLSGAAIWSRDKRLALVADEMGMAFKQPN